MSFIEVFAVAMLASIVILLLFIGSIAIMNYQDEKNELRKIERKAYEKYIERLERENGNQERTRKTD